MDTKFWGPDGWKLLHSITVKYPDNPTKKDKKIYTLFFKSIAYVLPCIYCRISFKKYIREVPIHNFLDNKKKLSEWLYLIHNKVNEKLRNQGLNNKKNPKFDTIYRRYVRYVNDINKHNKVVPGFDFMYSIAFNYINTRSKMSKNRINNYLLFFNNLREILPFNLYKDIYQYHILNNPIVINKKCNHSLKLWLYNLELSYKSYLDKNCLCFKKTCLNIEQYKVGCSNNTCRKTI